jgi:hypothetical protein
MTLVDGDWPVKISYGSTPCRGYRLVDLLGDKLDKCQAPPRYARNKTFCVLHSHL